MSVHSEPLDSLLTAASGGDPVLMRALVWTAVGLGQLAELIQDRSGALPDQQLDALRACVEAWTEPYELVTAQLAHRSAAPAGGVDLTQRQRQVLALLGDGLTAQAIAHRLCVSPRTVGKHLERVYRRLGTSDRLSTVLQAKRYGLLGSAAQS